MVVDRECVEEVVVMFGKTKLPEYGVHNQAPQICMGYMTKLTKICIEYTNKLTKYGIYDQAP